MQIKQKRIVNDKGQIESIPMEKNIKIGGAMPIAQSLVLEPIIKSAFPAYKRSDFEVSGVYLPRKRLDSYWEFYLDNPMHSRCIDLKADLTVKLGCDIVNLGDTPNEREIKILKRLKMFPNSDTTSTFIKMMWEFTREYYAIGLGALELARSGRTGSLLNWRHRPAARIFKAADEWKDGPFKGQQKRGYYFYYDFSNPAACRYLNEFNNVDDSSANELYLLRRPDPESDYYGLMQAYSAINDIIQVGYTKRHLTAWYRNNARGIKAMLLKKGAYDLPSIDRDMKRLFQNDFVGIDNAYKIWLTEIDKDDLNIIDFQDSFDEEKITKLTQAGQKEIALANGVPMSILDYFDKGAQITNEQLRIFLQMSISPEQQMIQDDLFRILFITDGIQETSYEFKKLDTTSMSADIGALSQFAIFLEKLTAIPESERAGLTNEVLFDLVEGIMDSANVHTSDIVKQQFKNIRLNLRGNHE